VHNPLWLSAVCAFAFAASHTSSTRQIVLWIVGISYADECLGLLSHPIRSDLEGIKMKKTGMFSFMGILIGASLLAACGLTPVAGPSPVAPVVATVAPAASAAPLATAVPQATVASSIPDTGGNCAILSKDDVGKVLGEAVMDLRDPTKHGTLCVYQTQNLILELGFLHTFAGYANSADYMQKVHADGLGDTPVDVTGLGDEAFYHGNAKYRILFVRKGDTVYTFGVRTVTADQSLASPDNAQALEKSVADLLMPSLP